MCRVLKRNAYNQTHNVLSGFTLLGQKLTSTQALGGEETKQQPFLDS